MKVMCSKTALLLAATTLTECIIMLLSWYKMSMGWAVSYALHLMVVYQWYKLSHIKAYS